MCLYVISSMLWRPLRFPHKNDVRFGFTPVVWRMAHVLFVLFVLLCIVVYHKTMWIAWRTSFKKQGMLTLRVVHIWYSVCVFYPLFVPVLHLVRPMLILSLDCTFLIAPSVFSNVYFQLNCPVNVMVCHETTMPIG